MAAEKLPVKDILAAIDLNGTSVWDELTDAQRKQVSFWLLNRYVSSIKGSRDDVELAIFKTNEYYNKNWNVLGARHPKLQWLLLCASGNTGKIEYHPWIGLKQKKDTNNKTVKLLQQIYPDKKLDEVELIARISTKQEVRELARELGYDKVDI
mgnify:CR=1 FL=1|jgi:hypothetical protein